MSFFINFFKGISEENRKTQDYAQEDIFYFRLSHIEILILPRRFSQASLVKLQHLQNARML